MTRTPRRGCGVAGRRAWPLAAATAALATLALCWLPAAAQPAAAGKAAKAASDAGTETAAAALPVVPTEAFYRVAEMGRARLSPSGRLLAVAVNRQERVVLVVLDLEGGAAPRLVANYADADVRDFHWVNDRRLVYGLIDLQRGGGDQDFGQGLFAVGADGSGTRMLVRLRHDFLREPARPGRQPLEWNHVLLHVPQTPDGKGSEVVVGKLLFDQDELLAVVPLRLNVDDMSLESIAEGAPADAVHWRFDRRGEPRAVTTRSRQGRVSVHWRGPADPGWKLLATMPSLARPWNVHAADDQGGLLVTVPDGVDGTRVLKRFDFAAGGPAEQAVVSTPGFDFNGGLLLDRRGPPLGLRVTTDAETTVWFDARLKGWQAEADQQLPGRINRIDCRRCTEGDPVLLVSSWSDRQPGELYLFRPTRDKARWDPVGPLRKGIDPSRMATLDLHRVRTRDGLSMPVWLTLPPAGGSSTPVPRRPAVLLVHGGPWAHSGHWFWRADAQFLAARGYVVIEPEFRGSEGYGARLFKAGIRQWGRAMQDDLEDALKWAVAQGHVDPQRVCIAGASYGGYAALMGPIRHPGLYRCAVAWVGVSDPLLLFRYSAFSDMSDESRRYTLPELVGDPQVDAAMLAEVSPLRQAARLKVPVLLAYGAQDRRVPLEHGQRMRDALAQAGNPPEWVVYADEGHGWLRSDNRIDFANRMDAFLARHLK